MSELWSNPGLKGKKLIDTFWGDDWENMSMYFLLNDNELMVRFLNVKIIFNYIQFSYSQKILTETFKVTHLQLTFNGFCGILWESIKTHIQREGTSAITTTGYSKCPLCYFFHFVFRFKVLINKKFERREEYSISP